MASIFLWQQHPMMVTLLHYRQQTQRLLCSYNRERGQQQVGRHGEGGGAELGGRRPLLAARPAPAQAAPLTDRAHRLRGHLHHRQGIHLPTPPKNCEFLPVIYLNMLLFPMRMRKPISPGRRVWHRTELRDPDPPWLGEEPQPAAGQAKAQWLGLAPGHRPPRQLHPQHQPPLQQAANTGRGHLRAVSILHQ